MLWLEVWILEIQEELLLRMGMDKTLLGVLYKPCHQRLISRATYISLRGSFLAHVKLSDTCPCENVTLRCAEEDYL